MNLLITGDKGFVGKNLISHLRKKKFKIITLEKKITKKKDVDLKKKKNSNSYSLCRNCTYEC